MLSRGYKRVYSLEIVTNGSWVCGRRPGEVRWSTGRHGRPRRVSEGPRHYAVVDEEVFGATNPIASRQADSWLPAYARCGGRRRGGPGPARTLRPAPAAVLKPALSLVPRRRGCRRLQAGDRHALAGARVAGAGRRAPGGRPGQQAPRRRSSDAGARPGPSCAGRRRRRN